jgi:hypothetical protein
VGSSGPSPEIELGGGAGTTSELGAGLVSFVMNVLRSELTNGDKGPGSAVVPNIVVLVNESTTEPTTAVSTK